MQINFTYYSSLDENSYIDSSQDVYEADCHFVLYNLQNTEPVFHGWITLLSLMLNCIIYGTMSGHQNNIGLYPLPSDDNIFH